MTNDVLLAVEPFAPGDGRGIAIGADWFEPNAVILALTFLGLQIVFVD
jgi:hypothetical protein